MTFSRLHPIMTLGRCVRLAVGCTLLLGATLGARTARASDSGYRARALEAQRKALLAKPSAASRTNRATGDKNYAARARAQHAPSAAPARVSVPAHPDAVVTLPPGSLVLYSDDMEHGVGQWSHYITDGADGDNWSQSSAHASSGATSWHVTQHEVDAGEGLQGPAIDLVGMQSATLTFAHTYDFDDCAVPGFFPDGGVIEVQVDGAGPWLEAVPDGGYPNTLSLACGNPLEGRNAFSNVSASFPVFHAVSVDLSAWVGHSLRFRFRAGWDCGNCDAANEGWFIDDVSVVGVPAPSVQLFLDNFEKGAPGWSHTFTGSDSTDRWALSTTRAAGGAKSYHVAQHDGAGEDALKSPLFDMRGMATAMLVFSQAHDFDDCGGTPSLASDGGIVEVQPGGTGPWFALAPVADYPTTLQVTCDNPLQTHPGFTGASRAFPAFSDAVFDLTPWVGGTARVRFRTGWDCGNCAVHEGWYVDDVRVLGVAVPSAVIFSADMESGAPGWTHYPSGSDLTDRWAPSTFRKHGGAASYNVAQHDGVGEDALQSPAIDLSGVSRATLTFTQAYDFDDCNNVYPPFRPDGGMVELQVGGLGPWIRLIPAGGYPSHLDPICSNPLEGSDAYARTNPAFPAFTSATFDLTPWAGASIALRFRAGWDCGNCGPNEGWYIDDVNVYGKPSVPVLDAPGGAAGGRLAARAVPNPVRGPTRIVFTVPTAATVNADLVDVSGRLVRNLFAGPLPAGAHEVVWNSRDREGNLVAAGVYFLRLKVGSRERMDRVVVLR